jgi:hypothetical protein
MAMRIILERRRTHFSASRLVWQEVRTGKIDFYHGLLEFRTQTIEDERQDAKTAKVRRQESAWPGGVRN